VVKKTYKHKPIYLVAKENGEIKGVLPLFLMRSVIFGKKLVSVPFTPYGGVCADNETIDTHLTFRLAAKIERQNTGESIGYGVTNRNIALLQ